MEEIMIWFDSCWQWCVSNKDGIIAFFGSAQFIALAGVVTKLIFQGKQLKINNSLSSKLNDSLGTNNEKFGTLEEVNSKTNQLEAEVAELKQIVLGIGTQCQDNSALTNGKLNTMLEVQQIVYNTIRDEDSRRAVSNLLTKARYDDVDLKTRIEEELETFKKSVDEQIKNVGANVDAQMSRLETVVNVAKVPKKKQEHKEEANTPIRG